MNSPHIAARSRIGKQAVASYLMEVCQKNSGCKAAPLRCVSQGWTVAGGPPATGWLSIQPSETLDSMSGSR